MYTQIHVQDYYKLCILRAGGFTCSLLKSPSSTKLSLNLVKIKLNAGQL